MQTLGAGTVHEAMAAARRDRAPKLAEALRLFAADVQPVLAKSGRATLKDAGVQTALRRVAESAPNHLSARHLLLLSAGTAKPTVSVAASLHELAVIAHPYQRFLAGRDPVTRATLPAATTAARWQINALRPIVNKDAQTVLQDLSAYVEKAEAAAGKQAKPPELNERRATLLAHLSALSVDREVLEKLVREGY